jgi:hypothetical protein
VSVIYVLLKTTPNALFGSGNDFKTGSVGEGLKANAGTAWDAFSFSKEKEALILLEFFSAPPCPQQTPPSSRPPQLLATGVWPCLGLQLE